jgi:hypothetical protein
MKEKYKKIAEEILGLAGVEITELILGIFRFIIMNFTEE